jgi:hypothetical protein
MFESRLSFLEFALEKMTTEVEDMLVGMEERKKGEQDVEGVRQGGMRYHNCGLVI